jgi:hypothetical protein
MLDVEDVIFDELRALAPLDQGAHPDWPDVLRRLPTGLSTRPRRRAYLAVAATLLLIAVAAPAFAFRAEIIDFLVAAPAPKRVVVDFGREQVYQQLFGGAASGVMPAGARRITSVRLQEPTASGATTSTLYVAPTKGGGFCALWTGRGGPECLARRADGRRDMLWGLRGDAMYPQLGVDTLEGTFLLRDATVEVVYADGFSIEVPYVWVTAPIDAGFFVYEVPKDRRLGKVRPVAVTVSRDGRTVSRKPVMDMSRGVVPVNHFDRWRRQIRTSPEAVWSKRRLLFDVWTRAGRNVSLWVMPSRRGNHRRCFASTYGGGCEARPLVGPPVQLQLTPDGFGSVVIMGQVDEAVARVGLRFEGGGRQVVRPKRGFVVANIAPAHFALRHRLIRAVGFDSSGAVVGAQIFDSGRPDTYPCSKPKSYAYGVKICP